MPSDKPPPLSKHQKEPLILPPTRSSLDGDESTAFPWRKKIDLHPVKSPSSSLSRTLVGGPIDALTLRSPFPSALRSTFESPLASPFPRSEYPQSSAELNTIPEASPLGRNLKWSSAYLLIISRVIGSGIFATPGVVVHSVGSVGLSLLLWLLGAIVATCGLAVSLELGCLLPRSGGEKVYLEFMYSRPRFLASTIVAVHAVLLGFTASNCIVFGKYLLYALNLEPTEFAQRFCAVGLLVAVTVVHGCFLKTGIAIQNALGWIKLLVVAFMAVSGIWVLLWRPKIGPHPNHLVHHDLVIRPSPFTSWEALWSGSNWSFGTLATSFFKVSYAYSGADTVNNVLDEVQNPIRTLKTAAPAALLTIFVFYFLLNIAYFVIVPIEDIRKGGELVAALFFERVFGKGAGSKTLPILIALSAAGAVMVSAFTQARVNQQIARQGFLPFSRLLSSSRPFNAPLGGLLVHFIPSVLVITLPPQGEVYSFILETKGYPAQFTSLAICAGLLYLRAKRPDLQRPFRAWRGAVWLMICLSLALVAAPFFPPKQGREEFGFWYGTYAVVGIAIMLFAVLYWYISIKLFPRLGGYRLEEEADVLADGTTITSLVKLKTDDAPPLRSTLRAMMKFNRKRSGLPAAKARVSDDAAAFIGQSDKSKEEGWVWQTSAK